MHFKKIQKETGIDFAEMLFFDNEMSNIRDCSTLGITCIYTPQGGFKGLAVKPA